ncbi:MAG: hypothetical protein JSV65_16270 [Armatimonadota bacterium]|nr:MAG: hypothetical protein JSV65_16270 [Armatimonadota bacterium]
MSRKDTRRGSLFAFAAKVVLVAIVAAVAVYLLLLVELQRARDARLEKLYAAGVPRRWEDVAPPPVPDEENAAILYLQAFDTLELPRDDDLLLSDLLRPDVLDQRGDLRVQARQILARNAAALRLLKQAAAKPRCRFPLDWHLDPNQVVFPQFRDLRACVRLLAADAVIAAERGDADYAVASCRAGVKMSEHVSREPLLIGFLTSVSVLATAVRSFPYVLERSSFDESTCRALFKDLADIECVDSLQKAMAVNACEALWSFEAARNQPGKIRELFGEASGIVDSTFGRALFSLYLSPGNLMRLREEFDYAGFLEAALHATAQPYRLGSHARLDAESRIERMPRYFLIARTLGFVPTFAVRSRDEALARRNAMQVALALEAYHTKHGAYPDSLDALRSYPGWDLPKDPFSGKPFAYRRKGAGFVLYSWGVDLDDDAGRPYDSQTRDGDMVWEFER